MDTEQTQVFTTHPSVSASVSLRRSVRVFVLGLLLVWFTLVGIGVAALFILDNQAAERDAAAARASAAVAQVQTDLARQLADHDQNIRLLILEHEDRQEARARAILDAQQQADNGSDGGSSTSPKKKPKKSKPSSSPSPQPSCLPVPLICVPPNQ